LNQLICHFLRELEDTFEPELLQSRLFVPVLGPLLVDDDPETRFSACDALFHLVHQVTSPVPDLVSAVWSAAQRVKDRFDLYLRLLAKCIENQGAQFPEQDIVAMSHFALEYLASENHDLFVGALAVATVLLLGDEEIHPILAGPTLSAVFRCLAESDSLVLQGLDALAKLGPIFREVIIADSAPLRALLRVPAAAADAIAACAALMPGLPFVDEVIAVLPSVATPLEVYAVFADSEGLARAIATPPAGGNPMTSQAFLTASRRFVTKVGTDQYFPRA
jgi:hypothetical protein